MGLVVTFDEIYTAPRQTHIESAETVQSTLLENKQANVYTQWQNDSTVISAQVLIYPEGTFEIGREGFVGKAKKVLWLLQEQKEHKATQHFNATATTLQRNEGTEQHLLTQSETVKSVRKLSFTGLHWDIVATLLLLARH